ncbi:MAG TPA: anhydro-N-acetylmuramic acid kinase [Stellaceae bacterium]|nr:anhydro-N-acetylmuramic acid kinase [Stellaceae bacterium]
MSAARVYRVIGLMSGTSLDGIDAAFLTTDGRARIERGPFLTRPYAPQFRARLRAVLGGVGDVAGVERELTELHAEAINALRTENALGDVDLVGFHGHTILHRPREGRTWQIGDGALLARLTGVEVVNDFRSNDVAAGGEGAPLAPLYHQALAGALARPVAVLNIGGVANVTWIGAEEDDLLAFDTGPGNALLDDWMLQHTGRPLDEGGAMARQGRVSEAHLARFLANPYFARRPPKSLDRDDFAGAMPEGLSPADGAATLTAMTAAAVAAGARHFRAPAGRWLVTGGGRHNEALMAALRTRLGVPVEPIDAALACDGDALEAQAFAYLAARSVEGLPLSLPSTTGARTSVRGGKRHPAR